MNTIDISNIGRSIFICVQVKEHSAIELEYHSDLNYLNEHPNIQEHQRIFRLLPPSFLNTAQTRQTSSYFSTFNRLDDEKEQGGDYIAALDTMERIERNQRPNKMRTLLLSSCLKQVWPRYLFLCLSIRC